MPHATDAILRKANKEHICDWCGERIESGERYYTWCWFDNGSATTVKSHIVCNIAANEVARHWGDDEVCFDRSHGKGKEQ